MGEKGKKPCLDEFSMTRTEMLAGKGEGKLSSNFFLFLNWEKGKKGGQGEPWCRVSKKP